MRNKDLTKLKEELQNAVAGLDEETVSIETYLDLHSVGKKYYDLIEKLSARKRVNMIMGAVTLFAYLKVGYISNMELLGNLKVLLQNHNLETLNQNTALILFLTSTGFFSSSWKAKDEKNILNNHLEENGVEIANGLLGPELRLLRLKDKNNLD